MNCDCGGEIAKVPHYGWCGSNRAASPAPSPPAGRPETMGTPRIQLAITGGLLGASAAELAWHLERYLEESLRGRT